MNTRVIPGAASTTEARVLILADSPTPPELRIGRIGVPERRLQIEALGRGTEIGDALEPLSLWLGTATQLSPNTQYEITDSTRVLGRTKTLGDANRLCFVAASCFYDGDKTGAKYAAALRRAELQGAQFKILMGDNLYLDLGDEEFDDAPGDVASIYRRHFWNSGYAEALSTLPTYASYDDHEFWNNYPESFLIRPYTADERREPLEAAATEALELLQHSLNPDAASDDERERLRRSFKIQTPLVSFFVADCRSDRTPDATRPYEVMPPSVLNELKRWAQKLDRPGVLVVGQPLWAGEGSRFTDLNMPHAREQYEAIWKALATAKWDIMLLSGDVHHSRLLRLSVSPNPHTVHSVYELTTSPARVIPSVGPFSGGSSVSFPEKPEWFILGADPEFRRRDGYLMGTDSDDSFALIDMVAAGPPAGDGQRVDVSVRFVDFSNGNRPLRPAKARRGNRSFQDRRGIRGARDSRCDFNHAFSLKKRS